MRTALTLGTPTKTAHLSPVSRIKAAFGVRSSTGWRSEAFEEDRVSVGGFFRVTKVYKSPTASGQLAVRNVAVYDKKKHTKEKNEVENEGEVWV
jgi:hypothetical protein